MSSLLINYPKTAIRYGVPLTGEFTAYYDTSNDVLDVYSLIRINGVYIRGEISYDPGIVSENKLGNTKYFKYTRMDLNSRIRFSNFKSIWEPNIAYMSAIIADYFELEVVKVKKELSNIGIG